MPPYQVDNILGGILLHYKTESDSTLWETPMGVHMVELNLRQSYKRNI